MIEVNEANYEELVVGSDQPFLLDFSATWCSPCQQLKPILEELATELDGKARLGHVDVDQNQGLAQKHSVTSVPTMILFANGKMKERMLGLQPKNAIAAAINAAIAG
jgi:thioredoxin 1